MLRFMSFWPTLACTTPGGMELAWRKWKRCPLVEQTWNNWKLHWTAAFTESRDIHRMTSHDGAFANQATAKDEQAAMMARSLDNLTNAALQKNDTLERLVIANECLAKVLADANAVIACLRLPTLAPSTSGNSSERPEWDPQGYCWLHRWKVKRGHSSATCANQKAGHDTTATRVDTKSGSMANKVWALA